MALPVGPEAGMEEPMGECEGSAETEATSAWQESDGVSDRDVGIGASAGAGTCVDEVNKIPGSALGATISESSGE